MDEVWVALALGAVRSYRSIVRLWIAIASGAVVAIAAGYIGSGSLNVVSVS